MPSPGSQEVIMDNAITIAVAIVSFLGIIVSLVSIYLHKHRDEI